MKSRDIVEGGLYRARVSGIVVTVKVLRIVTVINRNGRKGTQYFVLNFSSRRTNTFRSAMRFRCPANHSGQVINGQNTLAALERLAIEEHGGG